MLTRVDDQLDSSKLPPQVATKTAIDEFKSTLRSVASKKAADDRITPELDKTRETLADDEATSNWKKPQAFGADEGGANPKPQAHVIRGSFMDPLYLPSDEVSKATETLSDKAFPDCLDRAARRISAEEAPGGFPRVNCKNTFHLPLGEPIPANKPETLKSPGPMSSSTQEVSRKRKSWQNINPGSCSSGLCILAGDIPSWCSNMSLGMNSTASINRMFGNSTLSSHQSFKKLKSGDLDAKNHRRSVMDGSYSRHQNEEWGDGVSASVVSSTARQPQGNMFAGCMLGFAARSEQTVSSEEPPVPSKGVLLKSDKSLE